MNFPYKIEFYNRDLCYKNGLNDHYAYIISVTNIPSNVSLPKGYYWNFNDHIFACICAKNAYEDLDVLVDLFSEKARMLANKYNNLSPLEDFKNNFSEINNKANLLYIKDDKKKPFNYYLRESIFERRKETNTFKISWTQCLLKYFKSKKVLDPSAGWGDRILGASLADVEIYHGVDPNTNMAPYYLEMSTFISKYNNGLFKVFIDDFLTVNTIDNDYDTIFTSPPFYNYEIYSQDKNQSINKAVSLESWLQYFFKPYLTKAWNALAKNGKFIIYISDVPNAQYTDTTIKFINTLGGVFNGCIALNNGLSHKYWPIWIWTKIF